MQTLKASRLAQLLVLVGLLFITVPCVVAQDTPAQPDASPTPAGATQPSPSPSPSPSPPRVIRMLGDVELDDVLELHIQGLEKWAETHDVNKLVPYIDGRAIRGNYPEELHVDRGRIIYHLEITPENRKTWIDLLGEPNSMKKPVTLSVGLEDGSAFDSVHERDNMVTMTVISPVYGIVSLLIIGATFVLLVWLARSTNIIRERGPAPAPGKRRPYNLGRAQMAFWFFLIYSSYLTIWLIT
ncbi:MAG TPA: hypothetical protein VFB70_15810, partial [Pyrinomonadaceae bacterium]|nr:hypothetical protein [Pyrinomonadaceae bacterium]